MRFNVIVKELYSKGGADAWQRSVDSTARGYRKLRSFQSAQLVYDATVVFCGRFVEKRSRTHDQMIQAARSGVQNIAEGAWPPPPPRKPN